MIITDNDFNVRQVCGGGGVRACLRAYVCPRACVCVRACVRACVRVCVCVYMWLCACVCAARVWCVCVNKILLNTEIVTPKTSCLQRRHQNVIRFSGDKAGRYFIPLADRLVLEIHSRTLVSHLSGNWILTSCQPHRVTAVLSTSVISIRYTF